MNKLIAIFRAVSTNYWCWNKKTQEETPNPQNVAYRDFPNEPHNPHPILREIFIQKNLEGVCILILISSEDVVIISYLINCCEQCWSAAQ